MKTKSLSIRKEKIHVTNPITGKSADIVLHRDGTTDDKLAMIMLSPDATKEQKLSLVSQWFFERGNENASFLAELYLSKGTHLKETQAFKRQLRWDFESFANTIVLLFQDVSEDIIHGLQADLSQRSILESIAERLSKGADLLTKQREKITEERMREKGYGIYLDRNGQAYSIFDDDIVDVITKEKEDIKKEQKKK